MKAGSTGSTPGGVSTPPNEASQALQSLLNDIGKASFLLNTVVVGLDAVEKGHKKPDDLNVSWNPKDPKVAARIARKFAVESFMIRAAEALVVYVAAVSKLPRFEIVRSKWDQDTGAARKLDDVGTSILGSEEYLVAAGMLLLSWRNRIVHNGALTFPHHKKQLLRKNEDLISERYGGLDVDRLLCHAAEQRPTLKDASCLIAMSINLAKKLDGQIYAALTKNDVLAWLNHYGLIHLIQKVRRETPPEQCLKSIERIFKTNAPALYPDFIKYFDRTGAEFTDSTDDLATASRR